MPRYRVTLDNDGHSILRDVIVDVRAAWLSRICRMLDDEEDALRKGE